MRGVIRCTNLDEVTPIKCAALDGVTIGDIDNMDEKQKRLLPPHNDECYCLLELVDRVD